MRTMVINLQLGWIQHLLGDWQCALLGGAVTVFSKRKSEEDRHTLNVSGTIHWTGAPVGIKGRK